MRIILESDTPLKLETYLKLNELLNKFFNTDCVLEIDTKNVDLTDIRECYNYATSLLTIPLLKDRLKNNYNSYYIEFNNENELRQCESDVIKVNDILELMGYKRLETMVNEFNRTKVEKSITKDLDVKVEDTPVETVSETKYTRPKKYKTVDDERVLYGKLIEEEIREINSIVGEDVDITIEAEVFGIDSFESSKSEFKIITLKITDYTSSIYAKLFLNNKEDYEKYMSTFKVGNWYRFFGYTKYDSFSRGDLVFNIQSINYSNYVKEEIQDLEEEKRIELHVHTMMSAMDGLCGVDLGKHTIDIVDEAIKRGHKAIAITDHNGCQAFPIAYGAVKSYNKEKEDKDKFKVLYGTELTLVDDNVEIVKRSNESNLLESEFVVFDLETTGFNAANGDSIIEIGAVKLKDGEIIDKFDMLIKPPQPISERITSVTSITNEMVDDCPNEEAAVKEFIKSQDDKIRRKIYREIELLEDLGTGLRMSHSEYFGDSIFQLRVQTEGKKT